MSKITVTRLGGAAVPGRPEILAALKPWLGRSAAPLAVVLDARRPGMMRCRITLQGEDGYGPWFQMHAPTMIEAWDGALTKLRAGRVTPPSFGARLSSWLRGPTLLAR